MTEPSSTGTNVSCWQRCTPMQVDIDEDLACVCVIIYSGRIYPLHRCAMGTRTAILLSEIPPKVSLALAGPSRAFGLSVRGYADVLRI